VAAEAELWIPYSISATGAAEMSVQRSLRPRRSLSLGPGTAEALGVRWPPGPYAAFSATSIGIMSHAAEAHAQASLNRSAFSATTHCLTGCAIGEVLGMVIATALGWGNAASLLRSRSFSPSSSATP
jgi:Domain of unknown function (DUF4396)